MTFSCAMAVGRLAMAILVALTLARGATAQNPPSETGTPAQTQTLIDLLQDDAARARLIAALEATAKPTTTPEAAIDAAHSGTDRRRPIGAEIQTSLAKVARGLVNGAREDWNQGRATLRRLEGLGRLDQTALGSALRALSGPAAITFGVMLIGRLAVRPLIRRLGRAAGSLGLFRKSVLAAAAILLDLGMVVLAIAAAASLFSTGAANVTGPGGQSYMELYFGAFFVAGWLTAAIRAVLRPASAALRPLPLGDARARYWSRHLSLIAFAVIFSELLVRPIIADVGSPITARATQVAIDVAVILYLAVLVVLNRRAPAAYFERLAERDRGDLSLALVALVARYWHLLALVGLAMLAHQAMTSNDAALPLLAGTVHILAALAVGALALAALSEVAERGLRLPEALAQAAPDLEARLNLFIRPFLRLLRFVVVGLWVTIVLQRVVGLHPWDWVQRRFGVDVVAGATSVVIVIALGLAVWLVVSGWIDGRIAPKRGQVPTARQLTLLALTRNVALVAILALVVIFGLSQLGVSVAPLLASAGVIGLALSWGSQKLVQDIINGAFIQFENAINVGDVVEAAGKLGVVEKLTIRSVSLRDVEGIFHVIPFSSVESISNHMKGYSYYVADVAIGYRADIDAAKAAMLAAYQDLADDPDWKTKLLGGVEWFGVNELGESAMLLRARLKTRPGEQWAVGRAYAELVVKRFEAAGVEIPHRQLTLWFGAEPGGVPPEALAPLAGTRQAPPAASDATERRATRQTLRAGTPTDADAGGDGASLEDDR